MNAGVLLKKEAAEYLAIKEEDLLAHVRQGRLRPRDPQEEPWRFEVRALYGVAAWYDRFRPTRRRIAAAAAILALSLVAVGVCGSLCWSRAGELLARLLYCLGAGVAVIEQTVAQHAVGDSADTEATLLCLQNYRTEGGRGGS